MFLIYSCKEELSVKGYVDPSFQSNRDHFRSQFVFVFMLNGGAVTYRRSKQDNISYSSTESEYITANESSKEAVWLKKFSNDLGFVSSIVEPVKSG
mgnify:CR=1 FL=1